VHTSSYFRTDIRLSSLHLNCVTHSQSVSPAVSALRKVIHICSDNGTKFVNTECGLNVELKETVNIVTSGFERSKFCWITWHFPVETESLNSQVVVVLILQEVSAGGERAILGAAAVAASVSLLLLSDLPPVRQDPVPGAYRSVVLGHCLRTAGPNRVSWRAVVWSRSPVHRGALRRLAHVPHHPTTPYGHATDRTAVAECRVGSHCRRIQRGRQCAQVWKSSHRCWPGHHFPDWPQCNHSCVCVCVCVCACVRARARPRACVYTRACLVGWFVRSFVRSWFN
jgi:hypothetical protein